MVTALYGIYPESQFVFDVYGEHGEVLLLSDNMRTLQRLQSPDINDVLFRIFSERTPCQSCRIALIIFYHLYNGFQEMNVRIGIGSENHDMHVVREIQDGSENLYIRGRFLDSLMYQLANYLNLHPELNVNLDRLMWDIERFTYINPNGLFSYINSEFQR